MPLIELLIRLYINDNNLGIWADYPFTINSDARIGQNQFENGGLMDDKWFFCSCSYAIDFMDEYTEGNDYLNLEAALKLIDDRCTVEVD